MTSKSLKVVLAGGGTGGHIIPALALADEIIRRSGKVHFVGTRGRIEEKLVPKAGYPISYINVRPLAGGGIGRKIVGVSSIPWSVLRSMALLGPLRPDVVIGVGGYVAGPVVLAGRLIGAKTAFLEQNATIGLANRLLKKVVNRAFVSYRETVSELAPGKAVFTGNPVKAAILQAAKQKVAKAPDGPVRILVMGGSQGASAIDERVPRAMATMERQTPITVLHQGKEAALDEVSRIYREAGIEAIVTPFIEDTATAFANTDLVVARSGATTVAELTVMGLPAVFLPYPHHKDRQQQKNAKPMKAAGAALVLDEWETGVTELAAAIKRMVDDESFRRQAAVASLNLGRPDAAERIVDGLLEIVG